ncbi:hypothetical protein VNI00_014318 [Paramarasmius palmivorus]|uniref:NAD-dependent epimerase/dehydratase domain-containing protein n=1 Tax=Paramarasmius palmivorus TaxID=297713 RepID=A0AAW0BRV3_9AGAR
MPAVLPPAIIVVTGASGFVGAWICKAFLEAGYTVRGTVRSKAKGDYLQQLFKSHGTKFIPVIVEDISKVLRITILSGSTMTDLLQLDAFDKVVDHEVHAVIHVAGVIHDSPSETSEVFGPNTDSVTGLTNSILKNGKNVKRLIYMSSAQALLGGKPLSHIYTEDDWNDEAVATVQEDGHEADPLAMYAASKVHAERALIAFANEHEDISWDITRILPAFCKSFEDLNTTTKIFVQYLTTPQDDDVLRNYCSEFTDVRDVADAFVAALQIEEAGGERFIIDAGAFTYQNLYDAFHSLAPNEKAVPFGDPAKGKFKFRGPFCNSSKAQRLLKLKSFRGLAECAYDTFQSLKERKLLPQEANIQSRL